MPLTTYLFDLDDTLIDSRIYAELYKPILNKVKTRLNITYKELDAKARELGIRKNSNGRYDTGDLCREMGLIELYYTLLERKIKATQVLRKRVLGVFKELRKNDKRIGIVSNSMRRTIKLYFQKYNLEKYVDFIFSYDDAGCRKDEKHYWIKLIKKESLKPKECLMIGDSLNEDVRVPKQLGFNTLLVKTSAEFILKYKIF